MINLTFGTLNQNGVLCFNTTKNLMCFPNMRSFTIKYTPLSFNLPSLENTFRSFPLLTELEFLACESVDDKVLQIIIKHCRGLKILKLISCFQVSYKPISYLFGSKKICFSTFTSIFVTNFEIRVENVNYESD